jgi:glycosyltransferase involved in cell wall biosynthesis
MKIATLSNASVIHTRRWVEHFRARGHEVRLWSLERGPDELAAQALPQAPLPGFLRYPLAMPALIRGLRGFAPDLVDAHYVPNYGLMGVLSGWRPLSVSAWGSDLLISGRAGALRRARAHFVLSRADLVIADAENLARAARELGGRAGRVHSVPWGIRVDRFRPGERRPGLLLSTRMHEPVYDLETLIEGAAPVMGRRPELELVIAGDGSRRASLERLAAERLPAGRHRFVGRLDPRALADWLGRADLYLSGSHSDSTSLSLLEAMASGAVPVVSDIEGNREWVRDGEGARLFAPGAPAALAVALEAALADGAWRETARAHNRREVEARGDWNRNMAEVERLMTECARGARR